MCCGRGVPLSATHQRQSRWTVCTSRESDAILDRAHERVADFLGAEDGQCVAFGANMTTLTLAFSRAMARTWNPGDEIIVTQLDHDANVSPWVTAAADAGVVVHHVGVDLDDCTLRMGPIPKCVEFSHTIVGGRFGINATGTINPVAEMARQAHQVGAVVLPTPCISPHTA